MPDVHSKSIQPSGAHRSLVCTASLKTEEQFPDEQSDAAAVGTAGHSLAEYIIRKYLGEKVRKPRSDLIDDEVEAAVQDYVSYIKERVEQARLESDDATFFVEQQVSLEEYVKGCFGTCDFAIATPNKVHICDLKLGFTPVSAVENYQLRIYALGLLEKAEFLFDHITEVELTIIQPRIENLSTWTTTVDELKTWAKEVFVPKAEEALSGKGVFVPNADTCRFCKARFKCRARADYFQELAEHDFSEPDLLSDDEIAEVLLKVDALKKWAEEVYTYAETEAIQNHKVWHGFKVVRSVSRRKYSDDDAVIKAAEEAGFKNVTKVSPIGITEMERVMGKKKFADVLGSFVIKPEGKLKLVPESDKGEPVNLDTPEDDFKED